MAKEPEEFLPVEGLAGYGSNIDGNRAFVDVVGFGADKPTIRLEFPQELSPHFISTVASAEKAARETRQKKNPLQNMERQSLLEVTSIRATIIPITGEIALRLDVHNGAQFPLAVSKQAALMMIEQLQAQIAKLDKANTAH